MRTEKKTKMVEITETKYIADDGKEFASERECKDYEKRKERKYFIEEAEKLRVNYSSLK